MFDIVYLTIWFTKQNIDYGGQYFLEALFVL